MKTELARAFDLGRDFTFNLVNVSENETYKVETDDGRAFALRLNRPGYHTHAELASEMAWLEALHAEKVIAAANPVKGRNGTYLQSLGAREAILFDWEEGREPLITDNLMGFAHELGRIAATLHGHVERWQRPAFFTRPRWDFSAALGEESRWGDWRKGLGVTAELKPLFQRTSDLIERRLKAYGEAPARFNLIHGDLRLANLLDDKGAIKVIDFDDSGFGWLMYDAATMVSFHEHEAHAPELIAAWVEGYRTRRPLAKDDENEISTFIMFRRLLLVAWLGTHSEIDLAHELKPTYAEQTTALCEAYLARFG
ncbi:phosphotransferase enzyme family protein [Aestuariivirga litoralis]|uniref:phosphotransferase enzyme family protein n=1 Tax=Aestuariivirga litoralis TaxID=2650924 RepID=UPI001FEDB877|nr:phosphotransferase [Aestuariivirga litoralis]